MFSVDTHDKGRGRCGGTLQTAGREPVGTGGVFARLVQALCAHSLTTQSSRASRAGLLRLLGMQE